MITDIKWQSLGVIKINEGDTLFVRTPELITPAQMDELQSMLPSNVKVIYVAPDVDIAKLTPDQIVGTVISESEIEL